MTKTIRLRVTHPEKPDGPIEGFRFLWAFYVRGFDPAKHCQPCFHGELAPNFKTGNTPSGVDVLLDRMNAFPYVYVCGVGEGVERDLYRKNLHLPLKYEEGSTTGLIAYNGYRFIAENAIAMPIPQLPEGYKDLPSAHYRCKNFQFGVEYFGETGTGAGAAREG